MYAVIADSGRQFYVEEGQRILVDRKEVEPGQTIEFDQVLLIGGGDSEAKIGRPQIEGAKVVADVVGNMRTKKIHVGTYKRRKNFRRHKGHRQTMTEVTIREIVSGA